MYVLSSTQFFWKFFFFKKFKKNTYFELEIWVYMVNPVDYLLFLRYSFDRLYTWRKQYAKTKLKKTWLTNIWMAILTQDMEFRQYICAYLYYYYHRRLKARLWLLNVSFKNIEALKHEKLIRNNNKR